MQVLSCQRAVSLVASPGSARRAQRGFTLVELMVTMTIALVLIMIAVPSFKNIILQNKLTTAANEVVGAINVARMEAIKRNASTQLCGSASNGTDTLGSACKQAGEVYALSNGVVTQVRAGTSGIRAPIALTGNMIPVRFGGQGLGHSPTSTAPYSGPIADISTSSISTRNHRCIRITAGSILATTTSSAACPTS
ncbi:Type II secretion system protein H [Rhodanobacter sp. Root179]|uniref:GspH/FimT family pseudopilin n=1 Tax=Rhodanobacter sp. Root179 TaxID=1736482 RepID=UPI0006FC0978|nr:GspH/FimT family pseudopilin [Rhodanobacter sp. Root179]KRB33689.1 pilus assembly protein FimT [Rhodanobacter sp. Root179]